MMSPTHVATGLAVAAAVAAVDPALVTAAAAGGVLGGVFPDLDLFAGEHRKTLHFPVLGWIPVLVAVPLALVAPGPATVGLAVACLTAATHAASDVLGAGEELRPWERTNPNAVYCHACGRWLRARYVIRYDGAPEDLLLTVLLTAPALVVFEGPVRLVALGTIAVGVVYAAVRKRVVRYFEPIVD
ncbi:metal-dependent hydrolase [Halobium salinum]|uniref:Metal-dependent hydrolase n=1 Tax=Halobium salinum TaxID=1364940 RepID=A0ABD5PDT5_9EURY|nr:metal-dependent hydrolase [Halobium salinum]